MILIRSGNWVCSKTWAKRVLTLESHWELDTGHRHYSVVREARFMKKLVTGTKHSKRKWFSGESSASALKEMSFLMQGQPGGSVYKDKGSKQKTGGRITRRVGVLSTVFMEHITELLASGDMPYDFAALGLEITEVRVSSEFTHLNVYWYCSKPDNEAQLETFLKTAGSQIRHTLSQLRLIGQVPPIVFVKDKKSTKLMEVEAILSKLDFGDDYEPTPLGHNYKVAMSSHLMTKKSSEGISKQLEQHILSLEESPTLPPAPTNEEPESISDSDDDEESNAKKVVECPSSKAVRQDMLGLDWNRIMTSIKLEVAKTARKQNELMHPTPISSVSQGDQSETSPVEPTISNATRQKEFQEFLRQRRIQRSKAEKLHSNGLLEKQFLEQEKELRRVELVTQFGPIDYKEEEDYIEEPEVDDHRFSNWQHETKQ